MILRVARPEDASRGAEALAHLLAVLEHAAEALDWIGSNVDAKIVRAHRAQLERGKEWPGDEITPCEDYLPCAVSLSAGRLSDHDEPGPKAS